MSLKRINAVFVAFATLLLVSSPALGQSPIGARAAGMAGAFVGVADDATAVFWNPAGLATGALASFTFDYGIDETFLVGPGASKGGQRLTAGIIALSLPPLGLTYYRMGEYVAGPLEAAVTNSVGREEVRRSVQAIVTTTVGATVLQSLSDYLVVGTTLKLVRGGVARGSVGLVSDREALRRAGQVPRREETTGDLDVGLMLSAGRIRAGAVARNLTTPAFELDGSDSEVQLDRQVRVGGGWGSGWPGRSRVIVSFDADVTRRPAVDGDRRDVAVGAEAWWLRQRLGVRGGVRSSTLGERRSSVASGLSAGIANGIYIEAQGALGAADQRSWSLGARITF